MRILVISPAIPAKDAKGFQVLAYHRLQHLSKSHTIKVICFGDDRRDRRDKIALLDMGIAVEIVPWRWSAALYEVLKVLFNGKIPIQCALFTSCKFKAALKIAISEANVDIIYSITIRVLPNIFKFPIPVILDLVDSMALNLRRRIDHVPKWAYPIWSLEYCRVSDYEKDSVAHSCASFLVSSIDKREIGSPNINVLPLGVRIEKCSMATLSNRPTVIFTGNMSYRPNIDAAVWYAKKCWPSILVAHPDAIFIIAGRKPAPEVRALSNGCSIEVAGYVDDIISLIKTTHAAVAPMQSGSGMQFKILESMACGIPVITNTLGLGDIKAIPGKEILIAETAEQFIDATLDLLNSKETRNVIGMAGYKFVQNNHSWEKLNSMFEDIFLEQLNCV